MSVALFFDQVSEPAANRIASGFLRICHALRSRSWVEGGRFGLTPTQAQILTLMSHAAEDLRPSTVADRMQLSRATVTDAIAALVRKGLLARNKDPRDRRAVRLHLTEEGRSAANEAAGFPGFLVAAIGRLPAEKQVELLCGIIAVIRSLQAEGEITPARLCITCKHFRPNVYDDPDAPHHCALVDAPFGNRHLRVDCPEQSPARSQAEELAWLSFLSGLPQERP